MTLKGWSLVKSKLYKCMYAHCTTTKTTTACLIVKLTAMVLGPNFSKHYLRPSPICYNISSIGRHITRQQEHGVKRHILQNTLWKHAYSDILKISPPKTLRKFSDKNSDICHTTARNIDCGYSLEPPHRGGSNGYPQSMFLNRNKKIMYTLINPNFTI